MMDKETPMPNVEISQDAYAYAPKFEKMVREDKDFDLVSTRRENPNCGLFVRDRGQVVDVPCMVAARDVLGNWTVLTCSGKVMQYIGDEIW